MILIKAEQKSSRQSPQKVRLVADMVRGLPLDQAVNQLSVMNKKASVVVLKVMRQAIANAVNNSGYRPEDLTLHELLVNKGTIYRRFRAVSRGRAHDIQKPTCHVRVVLKVADAATPVAKKAEKPAKAVKSTKAAQETPNTEKANAPMTEQEVKNAQIENMKMDKTSEARKTAKPMAARLKPLTHRTTSK
jgi:large subunit ribosomal protein L22